MVESVLPHLFFANYFSFVEVSFKVLLAKENKLIVIGESNTNLKVCNHFSMLHFTQLLVLFFYSRTLL
jgi:hypothetical protein